MIRTDNISEIDSAVALSVEATIDPDFVRDFARAHEAAGFDRVLIGYHSTGPDAWLVAAHAAATRSACTCWWPTGRGSRRRPLPPAPR